MQKLDFYSSFVCLGTTRNKFTMKEILSQFLLASPPGQYRRCFWFVLGYV